MSTEKIENQELVAQNCIATNLTDNGFKDIPICEANNGNDKINEEISQIKQHTVQQYENKRISQCHVCGCTIFDNYHEHVKTAEHKIVSDEYYRDRIDFENYQIFSAFSCSTAVEFLNSIKNDFCVLVQHLILLENTAVMVDINIFALYLEENSNTENKNIAEMKRFDVCNKKLSNNTIVQQLYKNVCESFLSQSDTFQNSGPIRKSLEEIIYVEIIVVEKLLKEFKSLESHIAICHNDETDDLYEINNLPKTKLLRCKLCSVYVVQTNYQEHLETTVHKIALCYFQNDNIKINGVQGEGQILSSLIVSPNYDSIDDFLKSIESDVVDLICRVIKTQKRDLINVTIKMFGLYKQEISKNDLSILGDVKSFIIKNEILSKNTDVLNWYQTISSKLKSYNQEYLNICINQFYYLIRIMFLEVHFYEALESED